MGEWPLIYDIEAIEKRIRDNRCLVQAEYENTRDDLANKLYTQFRNGQVSTMEMAKRRKMNYEKAVAKSLSLAIIMEEENRWLSEILELKNKQLKDILKARKNGHDEETVEKQTEQACKKIDSMVQSKLMTI